MSWNGTALPQKDSKPLVCSCLLQDMSPYNLDLLAYCTAYANPVWFTVQFELDDHGTSGFAHASCLPPAASQADGTCLTS